MAAGRGSGPLTGAPAGRDTIEPLGLHMCGWAEDNHGCPWDSQTGYKIASRMQRRRKKPSVVRKETKETVARLSWAGRASPEVAGCEDTHVRVCRQSSPAPAGGPPLTWVGFHPGPWFPPGVVGPQAAKQSSPTRCASVPRMEKKSGSGPKRN